MSPLPLFVCSLLVIVGRAFLYIHILVLPLTLNTRVATAQSCTDAEDTLHAVCATAAWSLLASYEPHVLTPWLVKYLAAVSVLIPTANGTGD